MKKKKSITEKTLSLLLFGKNRSFQKYAGKHVMVIGDKVIPLEPKKEDFWEKMRVLEKRYGERGIFTFVPRHDISYILICSLQNFRSSK